ncbi:MAE_28990/MAE_18760 family HEPN-like nuclease [Psychrobacter celer]|uniref:MAE_28990/MAE_18760 family HEPN-like nuclease n=1 Tax=Psychrobacter celer TaxID=306572 RepID=UPI003FD1F609
MEISNANLQFAYENFETRLQEVKNYVVFVKKLADITSPVIVSESFVNQHTIGDNSSALDWFYTFNYPINRVIHTSISRNTESNPVISHSIDRGLQKTLRASTYLLLYNLMESTMSESIDAIHETIKEEGHSLLDLSEKLHKVILQSFSKGLTEEKVSEFSRDNGDVRERLFDLGYDKKKLFSGNIDCGVIKIYCKKYGIQISPYRYNDTPLVWDPEVIKAIKQKRNSLAHGSESFAQCGQNMLIDNINKNLESVEAVLMGVFNGLNEFLTRQKYLRASQ